MIKAVRRAILFGGDQRLAASRGEGKTKLTERVLLKGMLEGTVNFAVLFAANGGKAVDSLKSLRDEIETNDRHLADYPEVCYPVRALENAPQGAHNQLVTGYRQDNGKPFSKFPNKFAWCGDELILPNVPGSPSRGAILATDDGRLLSYKHLGFEVVSAPESSGIDQFREKWEGPIELSKHEGWQFTTRMFAILPASAGGVN